MVAKLFSFIRELVNFAGGIRQSVIEQSVEVLKLEYVELETAFLMMLLGPFVGVKTVPALLGLELLDTLKDEVKVLVSRASRGEDVLADLMSSLGGEW